MENSIIQRIKSYISPELIDNLGFTTNEPEANINKGFDIAIPAILASLFQKDKNALSGLFTSVKSIFTDENTDFATKISSMPSVLSELFDGHKSEVVNSISTAAGIGHGSAETVLNTSALGVFDYLKGIAPDFDLGTIKEFIGTNFSSVSSLLPAGLAIPGITGWTDTHKIDVDPANNVPPPPVTPPVPPTPVETHHYASNEEARRQDKKEGSSILKILIPLLLGIVLIFILYRSCNEHFISTSDTTDRTDTVTTSPASTPVSENTTSATREKLKVELPGGVTLDAYKGGIEDRLVAFLKTDYKGKSEEELKNVWFDFDNLNFETGKAVVTADSKVQLDNIVTILKAFPDAKIKIGGYTDKTGNESYNLKLSTDRAMAVKKYIADAGLGSQVTGAEGYGSEFATRDASASEEERALDRRISVSPR